MTRLGPYPGGIAAAGLLGRPVGLRFRDAFLGTVAAGALSFGFGGPALAGPAACTIIGTVATCTGNQSSGITNLGGTPDFTAPPVTTLNVNNLTQAIAPASGTAGIKFLSAAAITITSNTGTFGITTAGITGFGIYAVSTGAGAITMTSTGDITTGGAVGIVAKALGSVAVTVTSTGNITTAGSGASGIYASSFGTGAVTVTSTGNISTAGSSAWGIYAASLGTGAVTVTSTGNITTAGSSAFGIRAVGGGAGAVTVTSTDNISTAGSNAFGIYARNSGAGAVTVTSTGNITTAGVGGYGIFAEGTGGAVTVTSTGNITTAGSNLNGIAARSSFSGAVRVTSTGNITTTGDSSIGIYASNTGGGPIAVTINSGTVSGGSGRGAGVALVGTGTLTNLGTVTALSGLAIEGFLGNDTVINFGTVTGNVVLSGATNAFNNMAGGLFNAGDTVNLGAGNVLTNAGTLSPGGAGTIQTTVLTGNLAQTATGVLFTDINIAGATSDRLNVSGTANLAGGVQVQVQNAKLGPWQQTVLSAAGGTTINGLTLLASPALQAQLVYPNATDVAVKSSGINFLTPGLNNNQISLANAANGAAQTSGLGGPVFNFLLNGVTSVPAYNLALTQLSGEGATATQQSTFDAMNIFIRTMLDPSSHGTASPPTPSGRASGYTSEGDASAYAADGRKRSGAERGAYAAMYTKAPLYEPRWSVWAAGYGGSQTTDGNTAVGSSATTSRIAGGAVGADYRFSPNTIAGFALGGGGTNYVVGTALGTGRSDLFQAGAYVRHTMDAAYIAAALAYGWQDVTTNRTLMLAGLDQLQAKFNANAYSGRLEGGYRFLSPWIGIGFTPYAAGQFTTFDLPSYMEQAIVGSNQFALAYGAKSVTASRSELGFRTDKSYEMANATLTLRSRLAWAHDYNTDRAIGATFQTLPGASFVVNGAAQAPDKALTTAAAEVRWRNGFSLSGVFEGEFASNVQSYSGKGVVRYQW